MTDGEKPTVGSGSEPSDNDMADLLADMEALRDRADRMGLEMIGFLLDMALVEAKAQQYAG